MKGLIFVYGILGFICIGAIIRPWIGAVGYFGFAILNPQFLWRYSLPQDQDYQKFIVGATFIGLIFSGFKGNKIRGAPAWGLASLVAYLGWAWITAQFTIHEGDTTFYMTNIWKIVLMTCVGVLLIDTPKKIMTLMWILVIAQGWNAWEINLNYFQNGWSWAAQNGWGNTGNNGYSIFTAPLISISLGLVFYSNKVWQRCLAGVIFTLQMHQMMLLESRGSMLGSLVLCLLAITFMHKRRWTVTAVLLSIFTGSLLAGPSVIEEFSSSFKGKDERDSSAESRFDLWRAGWEITKDYPLSGVGPHAGQRIVPRYYPQKLETSKKALHNLFFEVSTGFGVPGLVFYLSFFGIAWVSCRSVWKKQKHPQPWMIPFFSGICGIPGYFTCSMFSAGGLYESSYVLVLLSYSALLIYSQCQASPQLTHTSQASRKLKSGYDNDKPVR